MRHYVRSIKYIKPEEQMVSREVDIDQKTNQVRRLKFKMRS